MFVTFEGPEGSGKTTQIQALYRYLSEAGYDVILTREPGGTTIGDQIRRTLLDPANADMLPTAEALLFSASRAQLVGQLIKPALDRGAVVICDRYADSTMAYQGYGYGLDLNALQAITQFATGGLTPDLTVYLDIEVHEGLRRKREARRQDADSWNRLDQKELAFHNRVRQGYLELAARDPQRWLVLDAARPPDAVACEIRDRVKNLLSNHRNRQAGSNHA